MKSTASTMHVGSLFQALLSALGLATCAVGAVAMGVAGFFMYTSGQLLLREQAGVLLALAWTLAFFAVVALPSLYFAARRILGRPVHNRLHPAGLRTASLALLLWPPVLAVGRMLSTQSEIAPFLLPPLQVVAVVLPLWWLVELAWQKLSRPSPQRTWGVLNFSVFFSTPLAIIAEIALLLVILVGVVVVISGQPALQRQFEELSQRMLNSASNPEALVRVYQPLLARPWFIFSLLVVMCGFVPLVEELLKPLAVWVLSSYQLTPAGGFAAGALAGAGFALLETLFSLINPSGPDWLQLTIGRTGTGLLHVGTAALMGWALADAWQTSRYLRLSLMYFAMAAVHGTWNAFSVLGGYTELLAGKTGLLNLLYHLGTIAPYVLGLVALGMVLALLFMNYRLRASSAAVTPVGSPAVP